MGTLRSLLLLVFMYRLVSLLGALRVGEQKRARAAGASEISDLIGRDNS
jgi:hypothetical protein